jgi:membrane protein DedA with SNARE-associated domain
LSGLVEQILNVNGVIVCALVAALVFAEDAFFLGFMIPGETAAVLGGVDASRGHVSLSLMIMLVIAAAIIGDSVGYEVGRTVGPRVLSLSALKKHREHVDDARSVLARRGGAAVFLGRFVAFFRAVMPALAGASRMPYRRFLVFNAVGGTVWAVSFVLLGYLAGDSYQAVEQTVGRGAAAIVLVLVLAGLVVWRLRRRHLRRGADMTSR